MSSENPKIVKAHCNACLGETNHYLLHSEETRKSESNEHGEIWATDTNEMLKCCGCDTVILRNSFWFSEEPQETRVRYFPPTLRRRTPNWIEYLTPSSGIFDLTPPKKKELYRKNLLQQIYIALNNDSPLLAIMGIRALLESVMIDKVGDHETFARNLEQFEKKGYVSHTQRTQLENVLEIGHATMHRHYSPDSNAIDYTLSFTETLLQSLYVHTSKAKGVKVPKRIRASKRTRAVSPVGQKPTSN